MNIVHRKSLEHKAQEEVATGKREVPSYTPAVTTSCRVVNLHSG